MRPFSRLAGKDGFSLQHFVLRAEIAKAYRQAVKATRILPDSHTRRETLDFLRVDLDRLKPVTDLARMREELTSFTRMSKQILPGLTLSSQTAGSKPPRLIGQKVRNEDLLKRRFFG